MEYYRDWDNDSNIAAYEIGADSIIVQFKDGRYHFYTYTYSSAGHNIIEEMKRLAQKGDGLNAYINEKRPKYSSKR
jgi:hypothetical protein